MNDFDIVAGDDKTLVITVLNLEGVAVDITNAVVRWRAAKAAGQTAALIKRTGGSGVTLSDPTNGQCSVTLDAADTENLVGDYVHECEVTFGSGTKSTVLQGRMRIVPALIRADAA